MLHDELGGAFQRLALVARDLRVGGVVAACHPAVLHRLKGVAHLGVGHAPCGCEYFADFATGLEICIVAGGGHQQEGRRADALGQLSVGAPFDEKLFWLQRRMDTDAARKLVVGLEASTRATTQAPKQSQRNSDAHPSSSEVPHQHSQVSINLIRHVSTEHTIKH